MAQKKQKSIFDTIQLIVLILGFGIMLGSMIFPNELRPIVAGAVDVIVAPLLKTVPFYIIVLLMAATITVLANFLQKYLIDWDLMRKVTDKNRAIQKEMREAQLAGDKKKIEKLQAEQMAGMEDQMAFSKQQLKPMGFLMIISIPLFFWMLWYVTKNPSLTMVFPFWGEQKLIDSAFFFFQYWIVWSIICSMAISQVIRKAFNVGISS